MATSTESHWAALFCSVTLDTTFYKKNDFFSQTRKKERMRSKGGSRLLWDFAQEVVGTTAQCSSTTVDGCEPGCLLRNRTIKRGGSTLTSSNIFSSHNNNQNLSGSLMCTHFTRPPVEILLTFPHEIEIHSIVIQPHLRSHCVEVSKNG